MNLIPQILGFLRNKNYGGNNMQDSDELHKRTENRVRKYIKHLRKLDPNSKLAEDLEKVLKKNIEERKAFQG